MSENTPNSVAESPQDTPQGNSVGALVGDWLDWKAAAEELGVTVSKVRQLIREHQLAAAVPAPGAGQQVPAALLQDGFVVKGVPGVLTLLSDGGWDDVEMLTWLFTEDDSLPGRPIDALRENRGSRGQAAGAGALAQLSARVNGIRSWTWPTSSSSAACWSPVR